MKRHHLVLSFALPLLLAGCGGDHLPPPAGGSARGSAASGLDEAARNQRSETSPANGSETRPMTDKIVRSDAEWKRILTPEQYEVMRQKGTERPFTGKYWNTTTPGVYRCAGCGAELFVSDSKFDSGCGWPSFDRIAPGAPVAEHLDTSYGVRTEVVCSHCGAHLGHVFNDGPTSTGMRYCINSASIDLKPSTKPSDKK